MARKPSLLEQHVYSRELGRAAAVVPPVTQSFPLYRNIGELSGSMTALVFGGELNFTNAAGAPATMTAYDALRCWTLTVERFGGGAYIDGVSVGQLIPWIALEGGHITIRNNTDNVEVTDYLEDITVAAGAGLSFQVIVTFPWRRRMGKVQSEYACAVRQSGTEVQHLFSTPTDPVLPFGPALFTFDSVRDLLTLAIIDDKILIEAGVPWRISRDNPGPSVTHTLNPRFFRTIWMETPNEADFANFAMELAGTRIPFQSKPGAALARLYTMRGEASNETNDALFSTVGRVLAPIAIPNRGDGLNRFQPQSARVEGGAAPANAPRYVYEELQRHITSEGVPIPPNQRALRDQSFARLDPRKQRQMVNFAARMPVTGRLPVSIVSTSWNPKFGG